MEMAGVGLTPSPHASNTSIKRFNEYFIRILFSLYKHAIQFSWVRAQEECSSNNADLASVTSSEENRFINQLAGDKESWIGGNDRETEGTFTWSDGSPWDTTKLEQFWAPEEPANSGDGSRYDCVHIVPGAGGRWKVDWCPRTKPFVCERLVGEI